MLPDNTIPGRAFFNFTFLILVAFMAFSWAKPASPHEGILVFSIGDGIISCLPEKGLSPTEIARGLDPDLSPDGRSIVFVSNDPTEGLNESSTIWIKNINTDSVRSVLKSSGRIMLPSWSPDGRYIAFLMLDEDYAWSIHLVKPDGSGFTRIAGEKGISLSGGVSWWPDGKSLIAHDISILYRYGLDGKEIEQTPLERFTGKKGVSTSSDRFLPHPSGKNIVAFTMSVPGTPVFEKAFHEPSQALFLFDMETKERKRLTPDHMLVKDIHWSRSGKEIYFSGFRDANIIEKYPFRIYAVDVETGEIEEICSGEQPSQ